MVSIAGLNVRYSTPAPEIGPAASPWTRCMSENTINAAFRRLGYSQDEITGHGLRRMASTLLSEHAPFQSRLD